MKNIAIIIALLVFEIISLKAQTKLGMTKNDIIASYTEDKSKEFLNIGKSSDGLSYVLYRDAMKVQLLYIYYFDNNGLCISDGMIMPSVNYPTILKVINDDTNNKSVGDDLWENREKQLIISVRPVPNSKNIIYQKSKLTNLK